LDKYEYRIRLQEINSLISAQNFRDAAGVADGIDWQRVKSAETLCKVSDVYKINKEYAKSRRLLVLADQRDPQNPEIIYSLCELTLFLYGRDGLQSDLTSALALMQNFNTLAPNSYKRLILQYKMYQVSPVSADEKIDVLSRLREEHAEPKWVYELAVQLHAAGRDEEAIATCRDLSDHAGGRFAKKAEQLIQEIESASRAQKPEAVPEKEDISPVEDGEKVDTDAALQRTVAEGLAQLDAQEKEEAAVSEPEAAAEPAPAPQPELQVENQSAHAEEAAPEEDAGEEEPAESTAPSQATLSISEVMAEWEKIRQSVKDTSEEKVAKKIMEDTGELFQEFDETSRHGLLEDIEKNVEKRHRDARASLESGISGRGSARYRSAQQEEAPLQQEQRPEGGYRVRHIPAQEIPEENAGAQQASDLFANAGPEQGSYEGAQDAYSAAPEQGAAQENAYGQAALYEQEGAYGPEEGYAQEPVQYADDGAQDYGTPAESSIDEEPAYEENEDGSIVTRRWDANAVRLAMDREKKRYEEFEARERSQAQEPVMQQQPEEEVPAEAPLPEEPAEEEPAGEAFPEEELPEEEAAPEEEIPEEVPAEETPEEEIPEEEESPAQPEEETAEEPAPETALPVFTRRRRRPVRPVAEMAEETAAPEQLDEAAPDAFPGALPEEEAPAEEEPSMRSRRRRQRPIRRPDDELVREEPAEAPAEEEAEPAAEPAPQQESEAPAEEAPAPEESARRAPRAPRRPRRAPQEAPQETKPEAEQEQEETAPAKQDDTRSLAAAGQRALTESEKKLFGPTCIVPENRRQILAAIDNLSLASYTGNIVVKGPEGAAKKVAQGILEITKHSDANFTGKIAKASGPALNRLEAGKLSATLDQISGGAMIVYNAAALEEDTLKNLHQEIEGKERGLIVIFADKKRPMDEFLEEYPDYMKSFTVTVDIQPLTDKALVSYGLEYAKAKDYSIDEMGQLALSSRISARQTRDHQVTTKEVRDLVDEAIGWASKKNLHTLMLILSRKRYDQDDRIIIHEKDFQHYEA
jgi:hypothetical protein